MKPPDADPGAPSAPTRTSCITRWFSDPHQLGICVLCGKTGIELPDEHGCRPNLPPNELAMVEAVDQGGPAIGFDAMLNRRPAPRPQPQTPAATPAHQVPSTRAVVARLDGLVATLAAARVGRRNVVLHWAACRVAEMLAAGELPDARRAADTLATVALGIGLDPREVVGTISSGFATYGVVT